MRKKCGGIYIYVIFIIACTLNPSMSTPCDMKLHENCGVHKKRREYTEDLFMRNYTVSLKIFQVEIEKVDLDWRADVKNQTNF